MKLDQLQADLKLLAAKAENAKRQAQKARDAANLAVEFTIDCEKLIVRILAAD